MAFRQSTAPDDTQAQAQPAAQSSQHLADSVQSLLACCQTDDELYVHDFDCADTDG